ncbi:MAG: 2-oxoglutarate dehydrogenase E1 component [Chloroflexi bacterium]|nr:2-oxoglutarate dehydrogenase E1 component [Chloroflexota bacterium]
MNDLESFYGPNAGYVLELYERYQQDPASIDAETRAFFDQRRAEIDAFLAGDLSQGQSAAPVAAATEQATLQIGHVVAATALANAIRARGHLGAHLDPLGSPPMGDPALLPETHGITEEDLARLPASIVGGHSAEHAENAAVAIQRLRDMYSGTISYQFDQVKSPKERYWLRDAVGLRLFQQPLKPTNARSQLKRLTEVEVFERYLHTTFPAQKRFSLEGNDTLVPMLDEIIAVAQEKGTRQVTLGMAHRGRLNVLAHVLNKPYAKILAEFSHAKHEDTDEPIDQDWSGDVKYHLGAETVLKNELTGQETKVLLAPNPSHLEYVNPVIQGITRAAQEDRTHAGIPAQSVDEAMAVVIHGDAAFPGEGIVAETLNLWNLRGYTVGGIIHIIVNNQIGFTTEPEDDRSTTFASDLARGFEVPILHVNGDDVEACLTAVRLAAAYRNRFHKDILIDLVGYRRWGHNEGDEPNFTQPQMYEIIRNHPTVREIYANFLDQQGMVSKEEAAAMVKEVSAKLEKAKKDADSGNIPEEPEDLDDETLHLTGDKVEKAPNVPTNDLLALNQALLQWPNGFNLNYKLSRLLQRRGTATGPEGGIDWGHAEALAFASILADGTAIRLSGQDAERGTFSHRHAVLHDQKTGETFIPLQHLPQAKASFAIYNSPISEAAVMGFEYGYSVEAEDALVIWEAQFGDFANVAQVIIDQFVSAGRAKWRQESGLVLLLPHGYEGAGPEHSSARLERYLALSAGENWRVANCSTAANFFHLLRQQAYEVRRDPRPLVVMTPKSLLRNPHAGATFQELTQGTFRPVIDDNQALANPNGIRRVVLCTGKVSIDLLASEQRTAAEDVAIVRVELLYPLPEEELRQVFANYLSLREIVWVQEEPENMGAWKYLLANLTEIIPEGVTLSLVARPETATPATGFMERFQQEQEQIIARALRSPILEYGGTHGH